jgi:hypothetical protein
MRERIKPTSDRILTDNADSVRAWCLCWACMVDELRAAVETAGSLPKDVEKHLRAKGQVTGWWDFPWHSFVALTDR